MRPIDALDRSLANTRKSMGDGTIGGRSRIATPFDTRRLRRATSAVTSATGLPVGELLAWTGTNVTIAGGGSTLATLATAVQEQSGFASVTAAGDAPVLPLNASYVAEVYVRWTDGYRGGASVVVQRDGVAVPSPWPAPAMNAPWGEWADQVTFTGARGETFDVEVTPADGGAHTADVTVRVAVVEPLRAVVNNPEQGPGLYLIQGDLKIYTFDDQTLTSLGVPSQGTLENGAYDGSVHLATRTDGSQVLRATGARPGPSDWTVVEDSTSGYVDVDTDNNGVWIVTSTTGTAGETAVYRSTDGGLTFSLQTTLTGGKDSGGGAYSLVDVMCDRNGLWIISNSNGGNLFWSTDAGVTWTEYDFDAVVSAGNGYGRPAALRGDRFIVGERIADNVWEFALSGGSWSLVTTHTVDLNLYGNYMAWRTPDGSKGMTASGGTSISDDGYSVIELGSGGTVQTFLPDMGDGSYWDQFVKIHSNNWAIPNNEYLVVGGIRDTNPEGAANYEGGFIWAADPTANDWTFVATGTSSFYAYHTT